MAKDVEKALTTTTKKKKATTDPKTSKKDVDKSRSESPAESNIHWFLRPYTFELKPQKLAHIQMVYMAIVAGISTAIVALIYTVVNAEIVPIRQYTRDNETDGVDPQYEKGKHYTENVQNVTDKEFLECFPNFRAGYCLILVLAFEFVPLLLALKFVISGARRSKILLILPLIGVLALSILLFFIMALAILLDKPISIMLFPFPVVLLAHNFHMLQVQCRLLRDCIVADAERKKRRKKKKEAVKIEKSKRQTASKKKPTEKKKNKKAHIDKEKKKEENEPLKKREERVEVVEKEPIGEETFEQSLEEVDEPQSEVVTDTEESDSDSTADSSSDSNSE